MVSRDPGESNRTATTLELLYDLCFVVAVAQASAGLHHGIADGRVAHSIAGFGLVFFAIWWAWMGFTWFASAFDTDDVPYRVTVLVQIFGTLVLAAGVPRAFEHTDYGLVTAGYAVMRVGLVTQWLRAALTPSPRRWTALRYAIGITVCQTGWIALLALPAHDWVYGWFVLAPLEIAVPVWAEACAPTTWHPHHIAERYGLMTIIVIGESVLSTTVAIQTALDSGHLTGGLVSVIAGAPLVFFSMWWLYFARPHHTRLRSFRQAFFWGYVHYFVFASAAAVGAGVAVAVDHATDHGAIGDFAAGLALAIPAATFLAALWLAQVRGEPGTGRVTAAFAVCAGLLLAGPLVTPSPLAPGLLLAALTAWAISCQPRRAADSVD